MFMKEKWSCGKKILLWQMLSFNEKHALFNWMQPALVREQYMYWENN